MRNFVLVASLALFAGVAGCSDEETGNPPGLGGSAGATAGAGGGGMGGMGMGGASGSAGSAAGGTGPSVPPPDTSPQATCTGCVELIAPLVGPRSADNLADEVSYIFSLGAPVDFSGGVITWRLAAVEPNANYAVTLFAQNGADLGFAGVYQETLLNPATFPANEFREISLDLTSFVAVVLDAGAPDGGSVEPVQDAGANVDAGDAGELPPASPPPTVIGAFNVGQIIQFGLFVAVNEGFTGSATVRVAVDQVTVSGVPGQPERTFTTGADSLVINQYNVPPFTPDPVHHP
jgi:hypothetical protein